MLILKSLLSVSLLESNPLHKSARHRVLQIRPGVFAIFANRTHVLASPEPAGAILEYGNADSVQGAFDHVRSQESSRVAKCVWKQALKP